MLLARSVKRPDEAMSCDWCCSAPMLDRSQRSCGVFSAGRGPPQSRSPCASERPGRRSRRPRRRRKEGLQPPRPRSRRLAWAIPAISVPTLAPPCVESDRQFGTRHGQTDLALHHRSEFEQRPHTLRKRRGSGGGGAEGERRGRDSNPRTRGCPANSFQGCRIQPLCHPSRMTRPKVVDFPAPLKSSMAAARGHARAAVGHAARC